MERRGDRRHAWDKRTCAIALAWRLIKSSNAVWTLLADSVDAVPEPNPTAIAVESDLVAFIAAVIAYRSKPTHTFVVEVCVELSKVAFVLPIYIAAIGSDHRQDQA